MDNPQYTLSYALVDTEFQPTEVQTAGFYGDHHAARLVISGLQADCRYCLEIVDGGGAYDITERMSAPNGTLTYDIPASWTAPGTARVRVVRVGEERGDDTQYVHYAPLLLYFADREDGTAMGEMLPRWQAVMTEVEGKIATSIEATWKANVQAARAENAANRVENAGEVLTTAAQIATKARDDALDAQQRANTTKGVYVGSGEMPQGYNVQIDPSGEAIEMADRVVEQGTCETVSTAGKTPILWTYRKWASGIAECWGRLRADLTINLTKDGWNGWYVSPAVDCQLYPFAFRDVPVETVTIGCGSVAIAVSRGINEKHRSASYELLRTWADDNASTCVLNYHVLGRWK